MSDSQVIARKFRPKTFDQVVGQEAITRTLRNAIQSGRLHHAYLFAGARGVGKTTMARILAKALNCVQGPTIEPCGVCSSCLEIAASSSIDVLEIDAASNTGVDNVRDVIITTVAISPARDRYKIFIIDEVHQLSSAAFNALLKTLEEPPSHIVFIMATTELHKVPETILSRCQVFEFRTITLKKIFEQLRRISDDLGIDISDSALLAIARAGEGSMRDAESALDQVISFSGPVIADEDVSAALGLVDVETLNTTLRAIAEEDSRSVLQTVEEVVARGYDLRNFCREMMVHIRALLVVKIAGFDHELLQVPQSEGETLVRLADQFSEQDLVRFFSILTRTEQDIRLSSQPRFQLEIGLMKLVHSRRLYLLEDALNRLTDIESRLSGNVVGAAGVEPVRNPQSRDAVKSKPQPPHHTSRLAQRMAPEQVEQPTALSSPGGTGTAPSRSAIISDEPGPRARVADPDAKSKVAREARSESVEPYASSAVASPFSASSESLPPFLDEPPPLEDPYEVEAYPLAKAVAPVAGTDSAGAVEKIKLALESRRKMILLSALDQAEEIKVDGEILRISLAPANAMFKSQIEGRENKKTLEEVSREVLGYRVVLSVTVGGQPKAEVRSKPKEPSAREQAEKHPAVQAFVDKFNGEIIDVIKPKT